MNALAKALKDYLSLRTGLGFKLKDTRQALPKFVSFLRRRGARFITTRLAVQWAAEPQTTQKGYWAQRLSMTCGFAKYLSGLDPRTEIPPAGILPYGNRRRKPPIYTRKEIQQLLRATRARRRVHQIHAHTYATIFGLLSVTGLRLSEAEQLGYLGFGDKYRATFEGSLAYGLTNWLWLASEFRGKANAYQQIPGLVQREDNWWTVGAAFIINPHATITVGWGHFGPLLNTDENKGVAVQAKYEF